MVSTKTPTPDLRLQQLRSQYAEKLPDQLEELRAAMAGAIRNPTNAAVTRAIGIAHRLAGTAGTYGFTDAAELGSDCERLLQDYQAEGVPLPEWELLHTRFQTGRPEFSKKAPRPVASTSPDTQTEVSGRILVVDDDEDFLTLISEILEQSNYAPVTTSETRDLLKLIESSGPELILLDVEMQDVDGFTVCRSIRDNTRWRNIPIIFLTARNTAEDRIAAFQAGGDDFINKPIVSEELLTRIGIRVERGRMTQERQRLLRQAEQQRDSLLSLLDQLRIGTLLLKDNGEVEFVSRYCASIGLDPESIVGQHWEKVLPLDKSEQNRLKAQLTSPATDRARLNFHWKIGNRQYFVEGDIRDAPGQEAQTIVCLTDVSELRRLQQEVEHSRYGRMVGNSVPMRELYRLIDEVARGDWTVLIEGETGVGKELVAHSVHAASPRKDNPFIAVNAAGLSESLLASQLFGHRKGAFTGAVADQAGFFESAQGGTLFLDEIGDLPVSMQASLLRVLQEKEITRLGETRSRKVDVRILAATHKDLSSEVRAGRFREDLLYRLRVARLYVPSLRERKTDIPMLVAAFLAGSYQVSGRTQPRISSAALQHLQNYDWPGNIRELKAAIDYAVIHCRSETIDPEDLPPEISHSTATVMATESEPIPDEGDERQQIFAALAKTGGNRLKAAKLLGISRATFYRRLDKLGISAD